MIKIFQPEALYNFVLKDFKELSQSDQKRRQIFHLLAWI